eukprot:4049751-Pleurochrysis_carterae.AAC.3
MPLPFPRSTCGPCRSPARACASGLGQSRGAERCGRRCRNRRPRGHWRPRWLREATSAAAVRTPCAWAGKERSQSCPGAFSSSIAAAIGVEELAI